MTHLPAVTPGVQGGPYTATDYTYVQELSTIPWQEAINTTKAANIRTEQAAIKVANDIPKNNH